VRAIEIFWRPCCALRADIALFIVAVLAATASQALAQGSEPRLLVPPPEVGSSPPSTAPSTPALSPGPSGANAPLIPAANPAAARLEVRMTQLEQDLRAVTGRLEEVSFQIRKLEERLNKLTSDMEYRLSQMKSSAGSETSSESPPSGGAGAGAVVAGGGAVAGTPRAPAQIQPSDEAPTKRGATPSAGASAPTQTANLPPRTPREQYARAFSLLEKRNYEEARNGFSEFLKANPNDSLADNARYWLGETYYARGDYARSAEIFLDGYEKNKTGPKAPDTLLKLGLSLSGLDKKKEACASFRELSRAFPNAPDSVKDKAAQESKRLGCT
jgi:tol-pal system protein YbgF